MKGSYAPHATKGAGGEAWQYILRVGAVEKRREEAVNKEKGICERERERRGSRGRSMRRKKRSLKSQEGQ